MHEWAEKKGKWRKFNEREWISVEICHILFCSVGWFLYSRVIILVFLSCCYFCFRVAFATSAEISSEFGFHHILKLILPPVCQFWNFTSSLSVLRKRRSQRPPSGIRTTIVITSSDNRGSLESLSSFMSSCFINSYNHEPHIIQ